MTLNRVMLIGNLTRDPEVRVTATGTSVAQLGVATNRVWTNKASQRQEEVEFHTIVAWGKLAEICQKYLGKGRKVYVEGRLKSREWVGQDGVKRNRTEIIAENLIMLDRAPAGSSSGSFGEKQASNLSHDTLNPTAQVSTPPYGASDSNAPMIEEEIKVEDIPF
ncbi:MAG: single-strand-binding protein [Candidatus Magasanikbacteria bacterium GW2011_GWA2_45_39]|uniref:Single-stranded DNA-binding protein n=1 Tax=Candidatus Magasanikbacteria bacterium GW2011_GWA2_45_39 TaxID=1619041 RepID=A0A0G1PPZ1_9BACT|nr:MAG: single-strand-binding protein [Candidatus Magasanikbacteria bacterium GW2011_GWA2_45_39]